MVTEHGREIAKIIPLRESSVLDQLMEEGEATRPTLGLEEFFSLPIPHADNGRASLVLEELRNDER